jgi:hypothetical protein
MRNLLFMLIRDILYRLMFIRDILYRFNVYYSILSPTRTLSGCTNQIWWYFGGFDVDRETDPASPYKALDNFRRHELIKYYFKMLVFTNFQKHFQLTLTNFPMAARLQ